jgi:purine nucleosidase
MPAMPEPLILDHDGAVDDLMTLLLVATLEHVDLRAVVVTEADCFAQPAVSASHSILRLAGRRDVPVGLSTARPVNPFPSEWRMASWMIDSLPILQATHDGTQRVVEHGEALLARVLRESDEPVTVLVTGPLSCLAAVLRDDPALESKVGRVVWMGGAVRVPGNVSPFMEHGHDGSAEWNAYWDPFAVAAIWDTQLRLVVCPVDVTEAEGLAPRDLTAGFVVQRAHALSDLAGQSYALVRHIRDYYLWDITTAGFLAWPELYTVEHVPTRAIAEGPSEGRILPDDGGRPVEVLTAVDADRLRERLLAQWAR